MGTDDPRREDPYEVLGVGADASRLDIVRAYRRAALDAHPDARPADLQAAARFRAITDAYELLSDVGRRAAYDRSRGRRPADSPAAPLSRPGERQDLVRLGPPLWVGPVHVQPPPPRPAGEPGYHDQAASAYDVLAWYLRWLWGKP
jgi:molecular chaperone DnaJ